MVLICTYVTNCNLGFDLLNKTKTENNNNTLFLRTKMSEL